MPSLQLSATHLEHHAVSHDSNAAFGKASACAWLLLLPLATWLPQWTAKKKARIERHTETRDADVEAIEKQPAVNREIYICMYIYICRSDTHASMPVIA